MKRTVQTSLDFSQQNKKQKLSVDENEVCKTDKEECDKTQSVAADPKREKSPGPSALNSANNNNNNNKLSVPKGLKWINERGTIVQYFPRFLSRAQSKKLREELLSKADWQRDIFKMAGKQIASPRLVSAFAEKEGLTYHYTGMNRVAQKWIPELVELKERIEKLTGESFNYVLVNRYDSGQNYIGWHSDKATNLKPGSSVVSLSLGQQRTFQFKNLATNTIQVSKDLEDGSLLIMGGTCQELYKHCLPKRANQDGQRLNLTFRCVI